MGRERGRELGGRGRRRQWDEDEEGYTDVILVQMGEGRSLRDWFVSFKRQRWERRNCKAKAQSESERSVKDDIRCTTWGRMRRGRLFFEYRLLLALRSVRREGRSQSGPELRMV